MRSILMFCISSKLSGGEIYTLQLLQALKEQGVAVTLAGAENAELAHRASDMEIPYVATTLGPKLGKRTAITNLARWRRNQKELRRVISQVSPDLVVLQYKVEQLLFARMKLSVPMAMLEHGPIPSMIRRIVPLRGRYNDSVKRAVATFGASQPAIDALESFGATPVLLSAGIDEDRRRSALAQRSASRTLLESTFGSNQVIGIYAGRLTIDKGVVEAARAIATSAEVSLAIFGTGPAEDELREIAQSSTNVRLMGTVSDALPIIAASDFAILLTRDSGEGRPLFAIECAAVGTPLIGSATSAAMRALREELGEMAVTNLREAQFHEVATVAQSLRRFAPLTRTWTEAARTMTSEVWPDEIFPEAEQPRR